MRKRSGKSLAFSTKNIMSNDNRREGPPLSFLKMELSDRLTTHCGFTLKVAFCSGDLYVRSHKFLLN